MPDWVKISYRAQWTTVLFSIVNEALSSLVHKPRPKLHNEQ